MTLFWMFLGVLCAMGMIAIGLALIFVIILMTQLIMDALFNGWLH